MLKISNREKIIAGVCLVLCLGFIAKQMFGDSINSVDDMEKRLKLTASKMAKAKAMVAKRDFYENKLKEVLSLAEAPQSQSAGIASSIDKMARQTGARIINFQPLSAREKDFYTISSLEVILEGDWVQTAKFIHVLQSNYKFINIEELTLEKYSEGLSSLRGRLVLSWMRFKS